MRILFFILTFSFLSCTKAQIINAKINGSSSRKVFVNAPGRPATTLVNYGGVTDNTFLEWELLGPELEIYNDYKGIRKKSTAAQGHTRQNNAWGKQSFSAGDRIVVKVSSQVTRTVSVALDSDKYSYSPSSLTHYDYLLLVGASSSAKARCYDAGGVQLGTDVNISAGDLLSIHYNDNNIVTFEQSTDGGQNWTIIATSGNTPADSLFAGFKFFHATAALDEVYKNNPVMYDYPTPLSPKSGVSIGNSTVGVYGSLTDPISYFVFNGVENQTGFSIHNIAISGNDILDQQAVWEAWAGKDTVDFIFVQIGLNDLNPVESAAAALARYQTLIDTINAQKKAGADVIVVAMNVNKQRLLNNYGVNGETAWEKWQDMNEAIMGNGPNAITGVDYRIDAHNSTANLDDGTSNLKTIYDLGDFIHENQLGRFVISTASYRPALVALGIISQ